MVGWHHRPYGHEFRKALGVGDGQGGLASCCPQGHRESDMTEWLNNHSLPEKKENKNPRRPKIPVNPQHDINKQQNGNRYGK